MQKNCLHGNDSAENRLRQQFLSPRSTKILTESPTGRTNQMIRYVLNYSNRTHLVANDFNEVKWMSIKNNKISGRKLCI